MPKTQRILPFAVFSVIMSIFALADVVFMLSSFIYTSTNMIWRYPSNGSTLLGALWFGQVCAALMTPVVLRFVFRVRQQSILLPWLILGGFMAVSVDFWTSQLINAQYDMLEIIWRIFHMPMASLQTMTLTTNVGYLVNFVFLQFVLALLFGVTHILTFAWLHKAKPQHKNT